MTPTESQETRFTVHVDSGTQLQRLAGALIAFSDAALDLPPLEIAFLDDSSRCGGSQGLFRARTTPWQITICDDQVNSIIEHELAHAWERANVPDSRRDDFLDLLGLEHWRDPDVPWNERGVEWAAIVIQQGVSGLPLPPALSGETLARLEGFELLTGRVAPVLAEWVSAREVPCQQRPTPLSRLLIDAEGNTCV